MGNPSLQAVLRFTDYFLYLISYFFYFHLISANTSSGSSGVTLVPFRR